LNPAGDAFLYFTLATWRTAAGLNESGFRRVPEGVEWNGDDDPVWSYGQMQAGDIIGPWIFEDLQKGFGALKWTARDSLFFGCSQLATNVKSGHAESFLHPTCASARQAAINAWSIGTNKDYFYDVWAKLWDYYYTPHWGADCHRYKGTITLSGLPTFLSRAIDVYIKATRTEFDFDSTGLTSAYSFYETFASSAAASVVTSEFSTADTIPFNIAGSPACPSGGDVTFRAEFADAVLKWDFTNA
jgi:hypothetical protein